MSEAPAPQPPSGGAHRRNIPAHPLLFALFPVLSLFAANVDRFGPEVMLRPAARAVAVALGLWLLAGLAVRNRRKGALIASLGVVLLYSYGHVVNLLPDFGAGAQGVTFRAYSLIAAFVALFLAVAWLAARARHDFANLTRILNFASACLVLVPGVRIGIYEASRFDFARPAASTTAPPQGVVIPAVRPNIFYIILDGYGRADNLREIYGFDNTPFIDHLRGKGFYVPDKARTNYSHTFLSLASSLNMEYLDGLAARAGAENSSSKPAEKILRRSKVREFLRQRGYRFISFASGHYTTEIKDADLYLRAPGQEDEFDRGVAAMTPLLTDREKSDADRRRVLFALETMPALASAGGPVFVFAHIICPHPPYVFSRDGSPSDISRYFAMHSADWLVRKDGITRAESMRRYIDQVVFINSKVTAMVDGIIANSPTPPIIILQADHGPCCFLHHTDYSSTYFQDRMSIFSAYYLPGVGTDGLYDSITPVNSFRAVFNSYFGTRHEMLPDRSYYSAVNRPYKLIEVTGEMDSEADRRRYEMLRSMDYYPGQ